MVVKNVVNHNGGGGIDDVAKMVVDVDLVGLCFGKEDVAAESTRDEADMKRTERG